jgi:hypothetical protein
MVTTLFNHYYIQIMIELSRNKISDIQKIIWSTIEIFLDVYLGRIMSVPDTITDDARP